MCRSSQFVALKSNLMIICKKCFFFSFVCHFVRNGIEPKALSDIDTDVCVRFTCNFFLTNIICFRTCGIVLKPSLKVIFQILPTLFLQSS